MKKFKFRLQKLLDIREAEEQEIKHELSKAVSEQNIFRNKQLNYTNKVQDLKEELHDKLKDKKIDFKQIKLYHNFESFSDRVIENSQKEIEKLEPGIIEIKGRLIEATKKRRTLEKLKEKKKKEYDYIVQRAENKENDDMNQKIFMRRFMNNHEVEDE